ncbi:MAG: hypothetical protein DLM73_09200 [Chthoniobacterales bacterium]|nr:MAG: hypothetical protein DLM73_09200 [Chthoniobacterales bacterium]
MFFELSPLRLGQNSLEVIEKLFRIHEWATSIATRGSAINSELDLGMRHPGSPRLPFSLVEIDYRPRG